MISLPPESAVASPIKPNGPNPFTLHTRITATHGSVIERIVRIFCTGRCAITFPPTIPPAIAAISIENNVSVSTSITVMKRSASTITGIPKITFPFPGSSSSGLSFVNLKNAACVALLPTPSVSSRFRTNPITAYAAFSPIDTSLSFVPLCL